MTAVVGVLGGRRGAGRTTLATNLAVLAAAEGLDTLLVDADPRTGGAAAWWALRREAPGGTGHGLRFLRCPPGRLRELALCAGAFGADLAVVDGPAEGAPGLAAAARACHLAVVPVEAEGPGRIRDAPRRVAPVAGLARGRGDAAAPVAAVAVRHAPPVGPLDPFGGALPMLDGMRAAVEGSGARLCPVPVRDWPDLARAAARGLAVPEFRPLHLAAAEVRDVWGWLRRVLLAWAEGGPGPGEGGAAAGDGAADGAADGLGVAFGRRPPAPPGGGDGGPALRLSPEAAEALVRLASRLDVSCLELLHDAVEGLAVAHGHRAPLQRVADAVASDVPGGAAMAAVDEAATALRDGFEAEAAGLGAGPASRAAALADLAGALLAGFPEEGRPAAAVALAQHMGALGWRRRATAGGKPRRLSAAPWLGPWPPGPAAAPEGRPAAARGAAGGGPGRRRRGRRAGA